MSTALVLGLDVEGFIEAGNVKQRHASVLKIGNMKVPRKNWPHEIIFPASQAYDLEI